MFNYDLNQNNAANFQPQPNNYCGGFALAAIINSFNNGEAQNQPEPLTVYNQIQAQQVGIGANSQVLVNDMVQNGTNISLPSSIAICAQVNYPLNPTVIYGNHPFPNVIQEEVARLNAAGIQNDQHDGNLQVLLNQQNKYMVLVDNGRHWVAVENNKENWSMYDPANGQPVNVNINGNAIGNYQYSGVLIQF
jgi:hypothetical protein